MELIRQIVHAYAMYGYETEVLAASIRHPMHVVQCAEAGADVATIPLDVIKKLLLHPLTDSGLKQVRRRRRGAREGRTARSRRPATARGLVEPAPRARLGRAVVATLVTALVLEASSRASFRRARGRARAPASGRGSRSASSPCRSRSSSAPSRARS